MQKQFYDLILRAANEFLNGGDPTAVMSYDFVDQLSKKQGNEVCMTIKNYSVPGGLSKQFQAAQLQKQAYEIKGPMGKGLGLN